MSASSIERFPYTVDALEQLDTPAHRALAASLRPDENVKRIIVAPPKEMVGIPRAWRQQLDIQPTLSRTRSWVLVLTEDRLLVATIDKRDAPPAVLSIPIADLLWVELGIILLFGWFECAWVSEGQVARARVFFNTVGEEHFQALRTHLCRTVAELDGLPASSSGLKQVQIEDLPFKLKSMIAIKMLLPDESIDKLAYHLPMWRKHLVIFTRRRAGSTVVILSPYHLLVGNEDPSQHDAHYGWITRYCPRRRVRKLSLGTKPSEIALDITVGLDEVEEIFSVPFPLDMAASLAEWATLAP